MITFLDNIVIKDIKLNYTMAVYSEVGDELLLEIAENGQIGRAHV